MSRFEKKPKEDYGYKLSPSSGQFTKWIVVHPNGAYEKFNWKWTARYRFNALVRHARKTSKNEG